MKYTRTRSTLYTKSYGRVRFLYSIEVNLIFITVHCSLTFSPLAVSPLRLLRYCNLLSIKVRKLGPVYVWRSLPVTLPPQNAKNAGEGVRVHINKRGNSPRRVNRGGANHFTYSM